MKMISFTLTNIDLDQIDLSLASVPSLWKKVRRRWSWGSTIKLKSKINRRVDGQHLIIWEWEMRFKPMMRIAALFLIDANLESSEVFVICPAFEMDEEFVHVLLMALLKIDDPSHVDVSSYLAQGQNW
ncbi:MAG: hypothetical protein ACXABY_09675 [Candidatus Thorarchaeota archaeon]|jgi:hypothetical protein